MSVCEVGAVVFGVERVRGPRRYDGEGNGERSVARNTSHHPQEEAETSAGGGSSNVATRPQRLEDLGRAE